MTLCLDMIKKEFQRTLVLVGGSILTLAKAFSHISSLPRQWPRCFEQAYLMGYRTFPIVAIMSFFIGAVLALQTGYSLSSVKGAHGFLGNIVGLSMCRELGPVMTAFLLAGRVGSAIAAELGAMTVYQEIDALRMMNISPYRCLVLPKIIAVLFMMPALAIFSIVIGWIGGQVVSSYVDFIDLTPQLYWRGLRESLSFQSVWDGLVKAEFFGLVVVAIACHEGFSTQGGPREIGRAVTRAVVAGMIVILLLDYIITKIQI